MDSLKSRRSITATDTTVCCIECNWYSGGWRYNYTANDVKANEWELEESKQNKMTEALAIVNRGNGLYFKLYNKTDVSI